MVQKELMPDLESEFKSEFRIRTQPHDSFIELTRENYLFLKAEDLLLHPVDHMWALQATKLARIFAKSLGLSEDEYIETLPRFQPLGDEDHKWRMSHPVIVERRIPLLQMLKLANIQVASEFLPLAEVIDWQGRDKFDTPTVPYSTWLDLTSFGKKRGNTIQDVRESLFSSERGANVYDAVSLMLSYPPIHWRNKFGDYEEIYLPGSQIRSELFEQLMTVSVSGFGGGRRDLRGMYQNNEWIENLHVLTTSRNVGTEPVIAK